MDALVVTSEEKKEIRKSTLVKSRPNDIKDIKLEDFKLISVLGRGTFGKVYLAELSHNKQFYAIKSIRKDVLIDYG